MRFLADPSVLLTLSVICHAVALFRFLMGSAGRSSILALWFSCFILYAIIHRFSSQFATSSPALQVMFFVNLVLPILLASGCPATPAPRSESRTLSFSLTGVGLVFCLLVF